MKVKQGLVEKDPPVLNVLLARRGFLPSQGVQQSLQALKTITSLDIQHENYFEFFTHYCPFPSPQLFLCGCSLIYLK